MIKNLENEIWKDIKGLNGEYQVSNKGRIKSKERFVKFGKNTYRKVEEKILKSSDNGKGYKLVSLGKNNERSKEIIAMDFDGNIILKFPSIGEAHRKGYSLAGISFCCNHKRNTYKGMIWSFTSNG